MPRINNLLHADQVLKLMHIGLPFNEAAELDTESASHLIEAYEIAMEGCEDDIEFVFIGPQ